MTSEFKEILICICLFKKWSSPQNYSNKTDNYFFYSTHLKCSVIMSKDKKELIFRVHSLITYCSTMTYQVCQNRWG